MNFDHGCFKFFLFYLFFFLNISNLCSFIYCRIFCTHIFRYLSGTNAEPKNLIFRNEVIEKIVIKGQN